ncbi:hypothetical protein EJ08DRAFT_659978 [Tothia fuscella]|uniref:DUF788 domain-containing protein n=1 Tax=Tothia fuscella TaxID=1048955 RepID=A0A9P4NSJ8_9PEZI|nr:hypothetical protein EJ08DRAFT_659978 [Tothia fuscella]
MAQKAKKTQATRNAAKLDQTRLFTLSIHLFYLFFRMLYFRSTFTRRSFLLYFFLSVPSLLIQYWFEKIGRPAYGSEPGELLKSGEDLDAKGLAEFLWDILYWTWGCIAFTAVLGDKAWFLYLVVPVYGAYAAYTTFTGARQSMAGMAGSAEEGSSIGSQSKRQQKMEKRGGQRMQYR